MGITGGKVYVGGNFTTAGGDSLARFLTAYALRQPGAAISGAATGPFVGNNVYSSVGTGELSTVKVIRGHSVSAYVRVRNDGLLPASFKLTGAGSATGFSVHYYRGSTDITSGVRAGTYTLPALPARNGTVVRLVVRVAGRARQQRRSGRPAGRRPGRRRMPFGSS